MSEPSSHFLGRSLYRLHNPFVGSTPAQVILHPSDNIGRRRAWVLLQESIRTHDHPGCAVPTLERIMIHECFLKRMRRPVPRQALDGDDLFTLHVLYGRLARSNRFIVDKNRAGAALAFPATKFSACEAEVCSQHPQQHAITVDRQPSGLAVKFEPDGFFHGSSFIFS
jgi:hypothetical protein